MKIFILYSVLFVGVTFAAIKDLPEIIEGAEKPVDDNTGDAEKPVSVPVIEEVEKVIANIPEFEIQGVINNLKNVNFYPVYLECLAKTFSRFGSEFMADVVFENDMITSVPLAYAVEYACEDKGYGMLNETTQLPSGELFRKRIESTIDDQYSVAKNYYLGLSDCYTACTNGQQPIPSISITLPKEGIPEGDKIDVDLMTKSFNIDTCAFRCYALGDPDRNVYLVDSLIYKYVKEDLDSDEGDDKDDEPEAQQETPESK